MTPQEKNLWAAIRDRYAQVLVTDKVVKTTNPDIVGIDKAKENARKIAARDCKRVYAAVKAEGLEVVKTTQEKMEL